ncbi:hypothetical protein QJQ45_020914 [Haematococcus lacustris]|nr:hypothetical protein QJQ45_020914 [Haematococcus lacustris]
MSLVAQCLRGSGPVPRSKSRFRLKARENKSSELRAAHIASVHASAGPSTPPGKQREERRAEWKTQRRQVIKVPEGAVLRGCKKTKRKLKAHFQLRAGVHSQLRVIASLYVLRIFLTCLVGYSTPGYRSAPLPPAVQPPHALDATPLPPLPLRVPAQPASMAMDWAPEPDPEPEPEPELAPAPPTLRPPSARLAARHPPPAAPTGPPMPLDSEDPVMLQQLKRYVKLYAKAARARLGWSGEEAQLFIKLACGYSLNTDSPELQADRLDKAHVNDMIEEAAKQRRLLALEEGDSLQDTVPLPCRMCHAVHVCRCLEQWQQPPTPPVPGQPKRGGRRVAAGPSSSNSSPAAAPSAAAAAAHAVGLSRIGKRIAEQGEFVFNPATQIGVGIDPDVTQAVSAASGVWDPKTGQLQADQLRRWKLTKGQVKHGSGLNNARRDTERWLAPIKPHLQHLAAASSAGTSLEANLKHITVTLATWDAVWEVYLDPKWAEQRLRLYGAQDRTLEQFFKKAPRSSQEASQPAASEPGPSTPLPAKRSKRTKAEPAAEPNKAQGKATKAKPAPQPGRWLDRDCNAALNMQRIGESKWRPLELCYWPNQGALPAKGKEYPGLGYKRLRDKPPKAQQQQPAVAQ